MRYDLLLIQKKCCMDSQRSCLPATSQSNMGNYSRKHNTCLSGSYSPQVGLELNPQTAVAWSNLP